MRVAAWKALNPLRERWRFSSATLMANSRLNKWELQSTSTLTGNMDPYVYPGTNVLRNLRDIRDPARLAKFEMDMTTRRPGELTREPRTGRFDAHHIQTIHRHIFQDVYPWAGEVRRVNISRPGQFRFAFPEQIIPSLTKLSDDLAKERHLGNISLPKFCNRAAHYMGELNAIHPFRDGNGRTQREFIRQLAARNGYSLDWSRVSRDQIAEASKTVFNAEIAQAWRRRLTRLLITNTTRRRTATPPLCAMSGATKSASDKILNGTPFVRGFFRFGFVSFFQDAFLTHPEWCVLTLCHRQSSPERTKSVPPKGLTPIFFFFRSPMPMATGTHPFGD